MSAFNIVAFLSRLKLMLGTAYRGDGFLPRRWCPARPICGCAFHDPSRFLARLLWRCPSIYFIIPLYQCRLSQLFDHILLLGYKEYIWLHYYCLVFIQVLLDSLTKVMLHQYYCHYNFLIKRLSVFLYHSILKILSAISIDCEGRIITGSAYLWRCLPCSKLLD